MGVDELTSDFDVISRSGDFTPAQHSINLVDASNGDVTVTVPEPNKDLNLIIKKTSDSGNTITIETPNAETIDGESSLTLKNQYVLEHITSDGSNFYLTT